MNPFVVFLSLYLVIVIMDSHYKFLVDVPVFAGVRQDQLIKNHSTNIGLMLGQRRRRWPNIKPASLSIYILYKIVPIKPVKGHVCLRK